MPVTFARLLFEFILLVIIRFVRILVFIHKLLGEKITVIFI